MSEDESNILFVLQIEKLRYVYLDEAVMHRILDKSGSVVEEGGHRKLLQLGMKVHLLE